MITLVIATKNYSSWSLRPWLLLRQLGIPFQEELIAIYPKKQFQERIAKYSKAMRAPVLIAGDMKVWDTLAIVETIAELYPNAGVWPIDSRDRAWARSICAEMHSGFSALRSVLPMNIRAQFLNVLINREVKSDIDRLFNIFHDCLSTHKKGDGFLFGSFCAADAYFAPVLFRFKTYGVQLPSAIAEYSECVLSLSATQEWVAGSAHSEWDDSHEPYQQLPHQN